MSTDRLGRALLSLALLCVAACSRAAPGDAIVIERIRRDLLAEEKPAWEVLSARNDRPPEVGVITPTMYALEDGADRLSLVLAPPAEVRFTVGSSDAPCFLRTSAGVDLSLARALARKKLPAFPIRFEILVDDRPVFDERIVTIPQLARELAGPIKDPHIWQAVGGENGIPLEPGDVVRLRTSLPEPLPPGIDPPRAGFADLYLVRHERRPRAEPSAARPNIVVVVMDTLRRDRTSIYGYPRPTTPALERFGKDGLVYDSAWSTSSWTWPATASILTGLEPEAHGVVSHRSCQLVNEIETLAEVLQEEGYTCVAFSGNPLVSPWRGFDQGFERFEHGAEFRKSDVFVPDALRWLSEHTAHPFFLYLHLVDPHTPHTPPRELMQKFTGRSDLLEGPTYLDQLLVLLKTTKEVTPAGDVRVDRLVTKERLQWLSDVYDAEVAAGDYWFGHVISTLSDLGLSEKTVVAFVADHGEELFDHGWLSHSQSLHEELVRVPLVLAGPGIPRSFRSAIPVSTRHLGSTLARLAGTKLVAADDALDLARPEGLLAAPIFFDTRKGRWNGRQYVSIFGLLEDGWMLHVSPPPTEFTQPCPVEVEGPDVRLYELESDPHALRDRANDALDRTAAMRRAIELHQEGLQRRRPTRRVEAGAATMELLHGIGYAGGEDEPEGDGR